jgi:hypothetical protein
MASARHMALVTRQNLYSELAVQYKLVCIRFLNQAILSGPRLFNEITISVALILAMDEVSGPLTCLAMMHV